VNSLSCGEPIPFSISLTGNQLQAGWMGTGIATKLVAMRARFVLMTLGLLTLTLTLSAATRLTYDIGGGKIITLAWPASAFPLKFAVDSRVINATPAARQMIIDAEGEWTSVADASVTFAPVTVENGLHAGADNRNTITFADDLFANQKCLAFTTPLHDDAGNLLDTDIQIDPSVPTSKYSLQQLVAHELGHALGLDHSASLSATMYPWIPPNGSTSLDSDDRIAIASIYPRIDSGAVLQGHVSGADGAIFAAQVVAVNADGEPIATGLSDQSGDFQLKGIPSGDYRVYVEPLDGPVVVSNLDGVWRNAKGSAFPTAFVTGPQSLHVESGKFYGNLNFTPQGNVTLNPQGVGITPVGSGDLTVNSSPLAIKPGITTQVAVGGDGMASPGTTFEILNPGFHRTSAFTYGTNYAMATFSVDASAPPGSTVILAHNGIAMAALTGALRIDDTSAVHRRAAGR
jgi:Matrixin